jgi:teichuronic acid biosynthesis glycosyltransferase TuaG
MRDGTKAYGINEALVKYRRVRGSISSNKWKSIKKVWNIYTKCENIDPIRATYYSIFFVFNALKKYYG